ncbi:MAG: MATE family efflux transporter [Erysipelotrichaceae bacterium]|nr:MATE family efflux transporter [Erysipelotrichaceae bacterium]
MNDNKMGTKKILPLLVELSIPAMVGLLVNAIYNIVDRMFIGNTADLGSLGLAGITVSYPVTLILMALGLMCGVGGSTRFSISLGAKEEDEAKIYQGNALILAVFFGLCFTVFGNLFLSPLLKVLGASNQVLPYAEDYLSIILFGAVFQCVALCGNNFSRAQGNATNSMISQMLGAGFNIVFDYILIIQCHMGMQGAALATIGGQFLSMVWQLSYFFGKRSMIHVTFPDLRPRLHHIYMIIKTGTPAFLLQMASSVLNIVINSTLGVYGGDIAISTVGIITSVQTLVLMPLVGITHGQQPIISYNFGAKAYHRVKETLKYTIISSTAIAIVGFIFIQCFPEFIISLFNSEEEIITLGTSAIRIWFMLLPIVGCQTMCANFFQSIGKVTYSSFLNLLRQCILLIPLILILSMIIGSNGVFIAVPIADALAFMITVSLCYKEVKRLGSNI